MILSHVPLSIHRPLLPDLVLSWSTPPRFTCLAAILSVAVFVACSGEVDSRDRNADGGGGPSGEWQSVDARGEPSSADGDEVADMGEDSDVVPRIDSTSDAQAEEEVADTRREGDDGAASLPEDAGPDSDEDVGSPADVRPTDASRTDSEDAPRVDAADVSSDSADSVDTVHDLTVSDVGSSSDVLNGGDHTVDEDAGRTDSELDRSELDGGEVGSTTDTGAADSGAADVLTVPLPPSDIVAVAISSTQIDVSWTDESMNEQGFRLVGAVCGEPYALLAELPANTTRFSHMYLAEGTTYCYRVRSFNGEGESPSLSFAQATTFYWFHYHDSWVGDSMHDIDVIGPVAFVGQHQSVVAYDVSDPAAPLPIGRIRVGGDAFGVHIASGAEDLAFVAAAGAGLVIVDVTDPTAMSLVGTHDLPGEAYDVDVEGDIAYVAVGDAGLAVVDIADLTEPRVIASFGDEQYRPICCEDQGLGDCVGICEETCADSEDYDLCYQVCMEDQFSVCDLGTFGVSVAAYGTRVVLGTLTSGAHILDVSTPEAPTFIDTPAAAHGTTWYGAHDIDIGMLREGVHAFIGHTGGLTVVDLSVHPPELRSDWGLSQPPFGWPKEEVFGVAYGDIGGRDHVYLAADYFGVANLRQLEDDVPFEELGQGTSRYRAFGDNGYAVDAVGAYGHVTHDFALEILDVETDWLHPILPPHCGDDDWRLRCGTFDTVFRSAGGGNAVAASQPYLLLADGERGMVIVDVEDLTDPSSPTFLGRFDTDGFANGIAVRDRVAYVADGDGGLLVLDWSDPERITRDDRPGNPAAVPGALEVALFGGTALVVTDAGQLYAVALDSMETTQVGSFSAAAGIAASDSRAFVAQDEPGLVVLDLSDHEAPFVTQVWGHDTAVQDVEVSSDGTVAYVANGPEGLVILDFSDDSVGVPPELGRLGLPELETAESVVVDGEVLLLLSSAQAHAVDVSDPTHPYFLGSSEREGASGADAAAIAFPYFYLAGAGSRLLTLEHH